MKLEIAWESHPAHVLEVGKVDAIPSVGDFVSVEGIAYAHAERMLGEEAAIRGKDNLFGYVRRRRYTYVDGTAVVRVWIHRDPL